MKMGKYLLLSTTVLGLINPLVTFADDNGASNQHNTVNNDKNINRKDKTQANDDKNQANDAKTLNSGDASFPTSGQSGTVTWNIDSNGILNMSGGVLGEGFDVHETVGLSQVEILDTIKEIKINGPLETTGSANNLFGDLQQLTKIEGLENLRTDNITDMTDMFSRDFELIDLNLSNFDTSNVVSMRTMFGGDLYLRNLDVSSFNTSKVTNMKQMFTSLRLLKKLDLSNFDTSNVTNMDYMFSDSDLLTDLDVSSFNTSNVKSMKNMFGQDYSLTNLDISSFDTTNTTNMTYFLSETPIHRLVLGKKTQLKGNDIELNNPDNNENYTGKWQTVGTGEDDNPNGDFVGLSNDIYARSTTNVSDTYVWQPRKVKSADVTVKYVDENGKQIENDAILTGNVGDAYKADEKNIPGYIFAEAKDGNESGKFT
ncbi:BspA family leucine-rich repeat surface protein, partial [Weissella kandleri]|uniref:BspA family leucine-rich repeat surface protein n=1 Tax=Weissella kandleri TaxID=1616 RepID=UPI0012EE0A50